MMLRFCLLFDSFICPSSASALAVTSSFSVGLRHSAQSSTDSTQCSQECGSDSFEFWHTDRYSRTKMIVKVPSFWLDLVVCFWCRAIHVLRIAAFHGQLIGLQRSGGSATLRRPTTLRLSALWRSSFQRIEDYVLECARCILAYRSGTAQTTSALPIFVIGAYYLGFPVLLAVASLWIFRSSFGQNHPALADWLGSLLAAVPMAQNGPCSWIGCPLGTSRLVVILIHPILPAFASPGCAFSRVTFAPFFIVWKTIRHAFWSSEIWTWSVSRLCSWACLSPRHHRRLLDHLC